MSASSLLPAPPEAREFVFHDRDFRRVCELIHRHAGIALGPAKRDMVYGRLSRRLRTLGIDSFREYLDRIDGGDTGTDNGGDAASDPVEITVTTFGTMGYDEGLYDQYMAENEHVTIVAQNIDTGGNARAEHPVAGSGGERTREASGVLVAALHGGQYKAPAPGRQVVGARRHALSPSVRRARRVG